jgi:hypothetical protein
MPESDVLDQVLVSFAQARAAIKATFGVGSAPEIVAAVLHGERSRNGVCNNGWEYYVHGVGYTVVLPSGGQVHLDGSEQGDFFTAYDVSFFLETEEGLDKIDAVTVKAWCETMCERNLLCRAGESKYSLP